MELIPDRAPVTAVLDTHIWLEWLLWESPRVAPLRLAHAAGALLLLHSAPTQEEWRRVLGYTQFMLTPERIDALVGAHRVLSHCVPELSAGAALALPKCRDLDDQKFLELCVAGGAELLLTRDKKLRKAGRGRVYKNLGLRVITLETWLAEQSNDTVTDTFPPRPHETKKPADAGF
jgi:uncharacterized protein